MNRKISLTDNGRHQLISRKVIVIVCGLDDEGPVDDGSEIAAEAVAEVVVPDHVQQGVIGT